MCATRNHTETIEARNLTPGDVLLAERRFDVDRVTISAGGRLRVSAPRGLAPDIWLEPSDRVQVVAA